MWNVTVPQATKEPLVLLNRHILMWKERVAFDTWLNDTPSSPSYTVSTPFISLFLWTLSVLSDQVSPVDSSKLDQQIDDLIICRRRRPLQINPALTRIDHFCPISCCAVPGVHQIRTLFLTRRNCDNFQKPSLLLSELHCFCVHVCVCVWIVNDFFCIIDDGRY